MEDRKILEIQIFLHLRSGKMGKVLETFLMIEDLKFCGINLVMYKNLKRKIPEWLIDFANCFNRKNYLLVKREKILKSINYILIWRLNNDTLNNNFFT